MEFEAEVYAGLLIALFVAFLLAQAMRSEMFAKIVAIVFVCSLALPFWFHQGSWQYIGLFFVNVIFAYVSIRTIGMLRWENYVRRLESR
jgi:hypothetical protein